MHGVRHHVPAPIGPGLGPPGGKPDSKPLVHVRAALHQVGRHFPLAGKRPDRNGRLQFRQPFSQPGRRLGGLCSRKPEPLDIDQTPDALGAGSRIDHRDIAAHAVTQKVNRRIWRNTVNDGIQVSVIVVEPVTVTGRSLACSEATPVKRDNVPLGAGVCQQ